MWFFGCLGFVLFCKSKLTFWHCLGIILMLTRSNFYNFWHCWLLRLLLWWWNRDLWKIGKLFSWIRNINSRAEYASWPRTPNWRRVDPLDQSWDLTRQGNTTLQHRRHFQHMTWCNVACLSLSNTPALTWHCLNPSPAMLVPHMRAVKRTDPILNHGVFKVGIMASKPFAGGLQVWLRSHSRSVPWLLQAVRQETLLKQRIFGFGGPGLKKHQSIQASLQIHSNFYRCFCCWKWHLPSSKSTPPTALGLTSQKL